MQVQDVTPERLSLAGLDKQQGHKFSHGHVVVVSGGKGRSGAARLAARGALRVGAGLVTLAVPGDAVPEVASQITALMMREIEAHDGLTAVLRDDRINALCIGPGLGTHEAAAQYVADCLSSGRAVLLDADALTLLAQHRELLRLLHERCVLTPHGGEFARLFPDLSERLTAVPPMSKAQAAAQAAERIGCVVLLKGAETVVAAPNGRVGRHLASGARAAPWLATAGAGDVLAGMIAGLIARAFPPQNAAELATYIHAEAARAFGPGLVAEDIPEQVPQVLARLIARSA